MGYTLKNKPEKAYSAITPAMILIAFVLVATTFSIMLLNVGTFIITRSENIIRGSADEASSLITVGGDVRVRSGNPENESQVIMFPIRLIKGSIPVNVNPESTAIAMSVRRSGGVKADWHSPNLWQEQTSIGKRIGISITAILGSYDPGRDTLLEEGELFQIQIIISPENLAPRHDLQLTSNDQFEINMKFNIGLTLTISRDLPGNIQGLVNLG